MIGDADAVHFVGHATCVVDLDGTRVVSDPVLRRGVAHLRRVVPLDRSHLADVDVVIVSHAHLDHLDIRSLRRIAAGVPLVVPRGCGRLVARCGASSVIEVVPGDELTFGAIGIRVTEALHDTTRWPWGGASDAVGYVLRGSSTSVYFAGDTDLFDGMEGLEPDLQVALVPVWGWGLTLGRGLHLDPDRAAEAVRRLQPRMAVPIHWGTFLPAHRGLGSRPSSLTDPVMRFALEVARVAPAVDVRVLQPGETLRIEPRRRA